MHHDTHRIAILAALLAAVPAVAQQERQPLIGRVVDAAGQALAGATVTAAWSPLGHPDLGLGASASTQCDARGYFAIPVPPRTPLAVWAIGAEDGNGRPPATAPTQAAIGVERFELVADKQANTAHELTLAGLDAWRDLGPISVRVHPTVFADVPIVIPVGDGDAVDLPALPPEGAYCEVVLGDGQILQRGSVSTARLAVLPPQEIKVRAVDGAGQPVADVAVLHRCAQAWDHSRRWIAPMPPRDYWRRVGTTDADGRAVVRLPLHSAPGTDGNTPEFVLRAHKPGHADAHSGLDSFWFENGIKRSDASEPPEELTFTMVKAQPLAGRLALPPAQRPRRMRIAWTSKIAEDNGWTHLPRSAVVDIADDGAFALPGLPVDAYDVLFGCTPISAAGPVALLSSRGRPPVGWDPSGGALRAIDVFLTNVDGAPMPASSVLVVRMNTSFDIDDASLHSVLDNTGRGRLMLANGDWVVVALDRDGYAFQRVPEPTAGDSDPTPLRMQLEPWTLCRGVVRDSRGEPVAGAHVSVRSTSHRGGARGGFDSQIREAVAQWTSYRLVQDTTDAQGRFSLPFLPSPAQTLRAVARVGTRRSERFVVAEEDDLEVILP